MLFCMQKKMFHVHINCCFIDSKLQEHNNADTCNQYSMIFKGSLEYLNVHNYHSSVLEHTKRLEDFSK
jgi:hypothetical protein